MDIIRQTIIWLPNLFHSSQQCVVCGSEKLLLMNDDSLTFTAQHSFISPWLDSL